MMYNSKLAIAVKTNGKVVKEVGENVYLPFGSEYSVLVKNLNTKRAIVNITIDGTPICKGGIVVDANQSVDLERFVKDNESGNRFKFIERTEGIEKNRGVGIEDGLIRVEFQFEKKQYPVLHYVGQPFTDCMHRPDEWRTKTTTGNHPGHGNNINSGMDRKGGQSDILRSRRIQSSGMQTQSMNTDTMFTSQSMSTNDAGITVPGSISNQKFETVSSFPVEAEKHVMILNIRGVTEYNKPVKVATPSRQKPKCVTCGRVNKASAKFCTECGTSLIVI